MVVPQCTRNLNKGMLTKQEQGAAGEQLAIQFLESQGLVNVSRNFRCKGGEIDLIMRHAEVLVFVEVRAHQDEGYGTPAETITRTKQRRLIRAASVYLQRYSLDVACRFDVVAITLGNQEPQLDWIQDAFQTHW